MYHVKEKAMAQYTIDGNMKRHFFGLLGRHPNVQITWVETK